MTDTATLLEQTTAQQQAASDPGTSAWVSANAGTGKTHVLVNRVARLLLSGAHPSRILCITYTRAAAAEMTTRLFEQLGEWSLLPDEELRKTLRDLQGEKAEADDVRRARQLFARALETPGGLKIQTIHAFCQTVLARFPVEARINPNFTLIEEAAAKELLSEARENLLRKIAEGRDDDLACAHRRLIDHLGDGQYDELLATAAYKAEDFEAALERLPDMEALWTTLWRHLGLSPGLTADAVLAEVISDDAIDRLQINRAISALRHGTKTSVAMADRMEAFWNATDRTALFEDYLNCFLTGTYAPRKILATKPAQQADLDAEDILRREQERLVFARQRLQAVHVAMMSRAAFTVGYAYLKDYERLKVRDGALDFADIIRFTRALLTPDREAWVHYKLDQGIDHVLVDEAQDTSPSQWSVIRRLTHEMVAGMGAADDTGRRRTVFAVGDVKQSIYRFQGADPHQFAAMQKYFADALQAVDRPFKVLDLILSFRSAAPVLDAVDATFEGEALSSSALDVGTIKHLTVHGDAPGLVELWPPLLARDIEPEVPWDIPLDSVPPQSPQGQLADTIAATIAGWIKTEEPLAGAGRPIRPSDIMILVRQRGAFMEHMIRCLKQHRVPVAGADRLQTTAHIAVKDLMAVARFALLPSDDLTLATVLKSPFIGFDDEQLFTLAHNRNSGLWQALTGRRRDDPLFESAWNWLKRVQDRADFMAPFEFFNRLLVDDGGLEKLLSRLGVDAEDPIDEFLTRALHHERQHPPSLESFLHTIEASTSDIKRDMDKGPDEVRVMTVHGAKGLQSEIVFLPDTCTRPRGQSDRGFLTSPLADDTELEATKLLLFSLRQSDDDPLAEAARKAYGADTDAEYRRLLYVAMTRAKERLYVCGFAAKGGAQKESWHQLVEKALEAIGEEFESPTGPGLRLARDGSPRKAFGGSITAVAPRQELPEWAMHPAPAEAPARRLSPSSIGEEAADAPAVFAPTAANEVAIKRGNLVHRLMETLPELAPERRAAATAAFLARQADTFDAAAQEELARETLALFEMEETGVLFGPHSRAEVGISGVVTLKGVKEVIEGRIDRLAVTDDAVWIIDYKTNRPAPMDLNVVPHAYLRQMAAYRAVLAAAYPTRAIRAALLWTYRPFLMELPENLLEKEWAELCAS